MPEQECLKCSTSRKKGMLSCCKGPFEQIVPNRPNLQQTITWYKNPPCWRASSLLFPHWDIKTKRPQPVKRDWPLFKCPSVVIIMTLPSSMADFAPCDRLLQKGYLDHIKAVFCHFHFPKMHLWQKSSVSQWITERYD